MRYVAIMNRFNVSVKGGIAIVGFATRAFIFLLFFVVPIPLAA
jgi:hypothetical protein